MGAGRAASHGRQRVRPLTSSCSPLLPQALLSSPAPDDPQDAVVARQYLGSLAEFEGTAKQWTASYAHVVSRRLGAHSLVGSLCWPSVAICLPRPLC